MQTAASLLDKLQGTSAAERDEWEAFAQTMYDEVGKARAEKNGLQRYGLHLFPELLACWDQFVTMSGIGHAQCQVAALPSPNYRLHAAWSCQVKTTRARGVQRLLKACCSQQANIAAR